MTCKVPTVRGLAPTVIWTGPDGKLADTKNITVGRAQTFGLETSLQTTDSDKYVSYSHYPHPWVYTLHLHAYYIGQALFQLKFGSVHHFSSVIFHVSGLHAWSTQVLVTTIRGSYNTYNQCNHS